MTASDTPYKKLKDVGNSSKIQRGMRVTAQNLEVRLEEVDKICALLMLAILSILISMNSLVCGAQSPHKAIPTVVKIIMDTPRALVAMHRTVQYTNSARLWELMS